MNTDIKNAVMATDERAQYDECAKRLLSNKNILAWILVSTVDVFKGMKPEAVVPLIEGEPQISPISIEPGFTNKKGVGFGERIIGSNTENIEKDEGIAWLDIVFYVRMPFVDEVEEVSQIIINIEAQKDEPTQYCILNRAVFYVCRMISSQKERDFAGTRYNDIKRVFSIWICMSIEQNCMEYVHLSRQKLVGTYEWKGDIDLLNIIFIGLSKELPEHSEKYKLHRLLGSLFSMTMTVNDRLNVLKEYNIPLERDMEGGIVDMCNLGQGVLERGIEVGMERGMEKGIEKTKVEIILNLNKNKFPHKQIADIVEKSVEEVEEIIKSAD